MQEKFDQLVADLLKRFGRMPNEDEMYYFIHGTEAERQHIWNYGIPPHESEMWRMAHEKPEV